MSPASLLAQSSAAPVLSSFRPITVEKVTKHIREYPSKSCESDPIPTVLIKDCLDIIALFITAVVSESITKGVFPDDLKEALVKPLLKKANLDLVGKKYRPVPNLAFAGKLIERVVVDQLTDHIHNHRLMEQLQSANTGTSLNWISSYLSNRSQRVIIGDPNTEGSIQIPVPLKFGVPQGSILGPILFTMYMFPLGDLSCNHGITYHPYEDDQQVYLSFHPSVADADDECVSQLQACREDIRQWMSFNMLKLNDDETEFIV